MSAGRTLRRLGWGVGGLLLVVGAWELYKALAPDEGVRVGGVVVLPRTTDLAMPHVTDMLARLFEPASGARNAPDMWVTVVEAALTTLRLAGIGWLIGLVVGAFLALLMYRLRVAKAAVLPWVVLSQTVPLIAIAPLVRRWGTQLSIGSFEWENWMSVSVIAAYLAFFPIAISFLKGLESPDAIHRDLMHTYGLGWLGSLRHLALPASVPMLLPGLRLAAANAIIGAVVAEVSIGMRGGIGRLIVEFASAAGGDPAKPWGPILGAIALGLLAVAVVALLGWFLRNYRRGEVSA